MVTSLLNLTMDDQVRALLDAIDETNVGREDMERRAMPREMAASVIHAAIWAYGSRAGDFAGAYAWSAMWEALGIDRYKSQMVRIEPPSAAPQEPADRDHEERRMATPGGLQSKGRT